MGIPFTGQPIKNTYGDCLQFGNSGAGMPPAPAPGSTSPPSPTYDGLGSPTSLKVGPNRLYVAPTSNIVSGSSSTLLPNAFNVTGTIDTSTFGGTLTQIQANTLATGTKAPYALYLYLGAGYAGSQSSMGLVVTNAVSGGTANSILASNFAGYFIAGASTTGSNTGAYTQAAASTTGVNFGHSALASNSSGVAVAHFGTILNGLTKCGGYFTLTGTTMPTFPGTALGANNGSTGLPIALFQLNGVTTVQIDGTGNLTFPTDNTYNIGASGATRPKNVYVGTQFVTPLGSASQVAIGPLANSGIYFPNNLDMGFSAQGPVILYLDGNAGGVSVGQWELRFDGTYAGGKPSGQSGLKQIAPQVIGITDGQNNLTGWIQQTSGRSYVAADVPNATVAMVNLSDLSIPLLAGRKYTGRMTLFCNNSTPNEGLQIDFNGGTVTATSTLFGIAGAPGANLGAGPTNTSNSLSTPVSLTNMGTTSDIVVTIEFHIVANAGGTLVPRFAELSHSSGTATIRAGSYLWLDDSPG
jgi:hypothetical protein